MRQKVSVLFTMSTVLLGSALVASGQVPSSSDMQQKLDQEMANSRRSASESVSSSRQGAGNMKSEAEKKMEETAAQHKSQAESKMTEEIEKAKQKAQGMGR
jgi:F0F1-type ATP synthase membrane subunit b/b'